jgi:hypothetical protein
MLGIGVPELVVIGLILLVLLGAPVVAIVLVVLSQKKKS